MANPSVGLSAFVGLQGYDYKGCHRLRIFGESVKGSILRFRGRIFITNIEDDTWLREMDPRCKVVTGLSRWLAYEMK